MESSYITFMISVVSVAAVGFAYVWWQSWDYGRTWKKNHPDPKE